MTNTLKESNTATRDGTGRPRRSGDFGVAATPRQWYTVAANAPGGTGVSAENARRACRKRHGRGRREMPPPASACNWPSANGSPILKA